MALEVNGEKKWIEKISNEEISKRVGGKEKSFKVYRDRRGKRFGQISEYESQYINVTQRCIRESCIEGKIKNSL